MPTHATHASVATAATRPLPTRSFIAHAPRRDCGVGFVRMLPLRAAAAARVAIGIALASCSYDWTVAPADAGARDADVADATLVDAATDAPASADGGVDAPPPDCMQLATIVAD